MFDVKKVLKIYINEEVREKLDNIYNTLDNIDCELSKFLDIKNGITIIKDDEYIDTLERIHDLVEDMISNYNYHTE